MTVPSTDTNNPAEVADLARDSEAIDNSTSPSKAPTTTSIRRGRGGRGGRGRGRSGGARGTRGGHGSVQVGEGVKRKVDGDVSGDSGPKLKKPRTALQAPPPREMSKRCAIDTLISRRSCILTLFNVAFTVRDMQILWSKFGSHGSCKCWQVTLSTTISMRFGFIL